MSAPNDTPPPITNEPEKRTRIRRNLAKTLIIVFCSTLLAIVFVRYFSHPHETAAQRQQREQLAAAARQPQASPDTLRQQLEAQRDRARAEQGNAASSPGAGMPKGQPGSDAPVPGHYRAADDASGALTADQRLALQRGSEENQSQSLVAYEDTSQQASSAPTDGDAGTPIDAQQHALKKQLAELQGGADPATQADLMSGMSRVSAGTATAQRNTNWQSNQGRGPEDAPLVPVPLESPYMVTGGTPIPTVILHGANSDMPGQFRAIVDRDIYDSVNLSCKLIPKGTKIVGVTNNDVAIGQERMQLAATKMYFPKSDSFPNGASMRLDGLGAADPNGEAGVSADVNNHFLKIFGSTFLIAGIAEMVGRNQSQPTGTTINVNGGSTNDLTSAAAQSLTQTTQTILQRNANIQPTLRLEPGQPMVFQVKRDMMIPPQLISGDCQ